MSRDGNRPPVGHVRETADGVAWDPPADDREAAALERRAVAARLQRARILRALAAPPPAPAPVPACNVCHGPGCAVCDPEGHPPARVAEVADERATARRVAALDAAPVALPFPRRSG